MAETFGNTNKEATETVFYTDRIVGCFFTSGSAGVLGSITLYIKNTSTTSVKCAIYDESFGLLTNSTTEEKEVPPGDDWITFDFPVGPTVAASTKYYLSFWNKDVNITAIYYKAGLTEQWAQQNLAYGDWPGTFEPTAYLDREISVYATYEEAPPPAAKTLVQAALISIPPLVVLPTLREILKFAGC